MEGKEFYEDDEEKRNSDSSDNNENNDNDSDDFGLPDLENADDAYSDKDEDSFEPPYEGGSSEDEYTYSSESDEDYYADRDSEYSYYDDSDDASYDEDEAIDEENQYYVHGLDDDEGGGPGAGVIILIIILVLAIAGGAFWFFYWKDRDKPVAEQPKLKQETVVEDTTAKEPVDPEPEEPMIQDEPETTTNAGEVNILDSRTGRYYVIVGSYIDDDLAKDYADKLASEGVGCTILSPNQKPGFYRLAVADFASLNDAAVKSEELKSTYGEDVWVKKY